jgi:hypothetical protein
MKNFNFCIYENKIFDLNGYEMLPDENNIVTVFFNGMERRFIADKMIVFCKESGYKNLFKKPKQLPKIKEPKLTKEILVKVKVVKKAKEKIVKVKVVKNKTCACGSKMTGKTKCRKCYLENCNLTPKRAYNKKGYGTHGGNYGFPKRQIECSNGRVYESLYQASKEIGINRASIFQVLNDKNNRKTVAGLTFKYIKNESEFNQ